MLTELLQALSDPTRRQILRLLQDGDLPAGEIAGNFEMTSPSISHHLKVLKAADLVISKRDGQSIIYSLNSTAVQEFVQELLDFFDVGLKKTPENTDVLTKQGSNDHA